MGGREAMGNIPRAERIIPSGWPVRRRVVLAAAQWDTRFSRPSRRLQALSMAPVAPLADYRLY